MRFNTDVFVGNMGESLRFGPDDDEVEDDDYADQEPSEDTGYPEHHTLRA